MELFQVESSNIAAIGYSEECRLLRVRYKDGSTYDYPDVLPAQHWGLMGSQSKGAYMALLAKDRPGTRLRGDEILLREPERPTPPPLRDLAEGEIPKRVEASILNTIEPDNCCTRRFAKEARTGSLDKAESWFCPGCGVEYRPKMIDGAIRHWSAHVYVSLVRPR